MEVVSKYSKGIYKGRCRISMYCVFMVDQNLSMLSFEVNATVKLEH